MTSFSPIPSFHTCPTCNKLYSQSNLLSFNNFHDQYYFDGYVDTIFKTLYSPIVQCQSCDSIFERTKLLPISAKNIAQATWKNIKAINAPSIEYYFNHINNSPLSASDELRHRLEAMWEFNHPFRKLWFKQEQQQKQHLLFKKQAEENEDRLLEILDDSNFGLITRADIHRRRAQFDQAKQVIKSITSPELQQNLALFHYLCTRKICDVVSTSFDPDPHVVRCEKQSEDQKSFATNLAYVWHGKRYLTTSTSSKYSLKAWLIMLSITFTLFMGLLYFVFA